MDSSDPPESCGELSPHAFLISWAFWQQHEYLPIPTPFTTTTLFLNVSWLSLNFESPRVVWILSRMFCDNPNFPLPYIFCYNPDECKETKRACASVFQDLSNLFFCMPFVKTGTAKWVKTSEWQDVFFLFDVLNSLKHTETVRLMHLFIPTPAHFSVYNKLMHI